ncbi:MAG: PDZ domain-containing protein [Terracidiphilus sp.]
MGARSAAAQSSGLAQMMDEPNAILRSSSQGYMGVLVGDVDSDSAAKLKLKEVRGALITLIDHDAPAAQAGIRVSDVVVQVNGQPVEGAEQFTRMMREIPAGRSVSLLISRDGNLQTIGVQLVDRKKMEHDAWNRLDNGGDPAASAPGMGILGGGGGDVPSGGFHMPFVGTSTLNVGAMVEPLTSQMAEYLGIQSGLMIKQVARKSEAEKAGLKAFDVILKVGADSVATTADWDRALRANQDKPVTVTVLRDRRQQTVTLQVDAKRHRSEREEMFPFGEEDCPLMAALDSNIADALAQDIAGDDSATQSMPDPLSAGLLSISPEQAEQFRKQAEEAAKEFRDQFKGQAFPFDQKQMDELKRQMEQFQKQFKAEDFKFDQKQFDQQRMPQLQHKMDQFKRQLEEMQAQGFDHFV